MKELKVPLKPDAMSPAGAKIRYLLENDMGNMIHSTLFPGEISKTTAHATVSEFWHITKGIGALWRNDGETDKTIMIKEGMSVDIPVGTRFQYRNNGEEDLEFICIAMPKWPGDDEARHFFGPWESTIEDD